jgi:hypothetical protein
VGGACRWFGSVLLGNHFWYFAGRRGGKKWLREPFDSRVALAPDANDTDGDTEFTGIDRLPCATGSFPARH